MIDENINKLLEKETFQRKDEEAIFSYLSEHPSKELKDKIALKNIGLIGKTMSMHKSFFAGDEYEDLWQEGFIGLYAAIDRYDYKSGYRFSTFSYHYIYRYMYNYLHENKTIRLPRNFTTTMTKINIFSTEYKKKYGKEPSIDEIAKAMNMTAEQVKKICDPNNCLSSLDYIVSREDDDLKLMDLISSNISVENDICFRKDMENLLGILKSKLKEKEYDVLMKRYGFTNDGIPKTLTEIGNEMELSRERVRQIEKKALQKIRRIQNIKEFAPTYD